MARKKILYRLLSQLEQAGRKALRLGKQVGHKNGRMDALRHGLEARLRETEELLASQPVDHNRLRRTADRLFVSIVSYLSQLIAEMAGEG